MSFQVTNPKPIDLFDNPAELVALVDPLIRNETIKIHPWQLRLHHDFAVPTTAESPYLGAVRAANSSGKDKMCIAPCVVWLGTKYAECNSFVTSSSGRQLDTQTDTYINQLCQGVNRYFGSEVWKCNYREYRNTVTGSVIDLFATDEPGKAEGQHPIIHGGQMGIFTSEAKSIPDLIFAAIDRCYGFTKRLDVSSPGVAAGHFYDICTRKELGWKEYHITAMDCPHFSQKEIDRVRLIYGESSVWYRSSILGEFGAMDGELIVIDPEKLCRLLRLMGQLEHLRSRFNTGGLDLAAGGDETVLAVRNGNKLVALEPFKIADTARQIRHIESLFRKYDLVSTDSPVWADAGGLGKPIIDQLRDRGWKNVNYTMNQWEPRDKIAYANLGTENWFKLARLVEEMEIILLKDDGLEKQLGLRYYKVRPDNSFILESKIQARAKGHPSPDRGDAVVLCFSDYKPTYLTREHRVTQNVPVKSLPPRPNLTLRQLCVKQDERIPLNVKKTTALEMDRLVAETNLINNRLKTFFTVKKLLEDKKD